MKKLKQLINKYQGWYFIVLMCISLVLFILPYFLYQIVSWSNHLQGLDSACVHSVFFTIVWCLFLLPYGLIIYALYRWKKWKRFLFLWIVGPMLLICLNDIFTTIINYPTPLQRFKNFTKIELPKKVENFHYNFSGGGFADYADTYYFECMPVETKRLIREFKFEGFKYIDKSQFQCSVRMLAGCPDYKKWSGGKIYKGGDGSWFYYLVTNKSGTQVYVFVGCI